MLKLYHRFLSGHTFCGRGKPVGCLRQPSFIARIKPWTFERDGHRAGFCGALII